jgi:hypothetical protein
MTALLDTLLEPSFDEVGKVYLYLEDILGVTTA